MTAVQNFNGLTELRITRSEDDVLCVSGRRHDRTLDALDDSPPNTMSKDSFPAVCSSITCDAPSTACNLTTVHDRWSVEVSKRK